MFEQKPLPYGADAIAGISAATFTMHHDTLYAGYVKKSQEIATELDAVARGEKELPPANATWSALRSLKDAEVFARNATVLHEYYFASLTPDAQEPEGALAQALTERFGSVEAFLGYFASCGIASRGWTVLAWDTNTNTLEVFNADAHHQGGVWGAIPLLVLDVYEHAYVADYGADRKKYISAFLARVNWQQVAARLAPFISH